jgi:hypothetical protein
MELAIGIVVGIILLLGRLADWFEERSFLLWLVFYLLAGGLTIVLFGTAKTYGGPSAGWFQGDLPQAPAHGSEPSSAPQREGSAG